MTLTEAIEKFIAYLKELSRSPSTVTAYSKDIEQLADYLRREHSISVIQDIQSKHLIEYVKSMKSDNKFGYTLKTISRKINSMKTLFKYLTSEQVIKEDPALEVKHHKYEVQPPRILSKLEYRALRDVARSNGRLYTIVELLLQTGLRIGELARLTLDDIQLDGTKKMIVIRKYASNIERNVDLTEEAERAIQKYLSIRPQPKEGVNALFVTKTGSPLLVRNIRTSISRAFEKAGINGAKVNDIRNTFIVHQLKNGMPQEVVASVVGHKRLTSTQKYIKLTGETSKRKTTKIVPL